MATYEYIGYNSPDGAIFGKSSSEKIGFYGTTPAVQPSAITAVTTTSITSVTTAAATTTAYGYATSAQADAIVASLNDLITRVASLETSSNDSASALATLGLIAS